MNEVNRMKEVTYPNGVLSKALYVPGEIWAVGLVG